MKRLAILLALCAITSSAFAQQDDSHDYTATLLAGAFSRYVGDTGGILYIARPVNQSSLTISSNRTGIYATVWQSLPFNGRFRDTFARETDWSVGINRSFGLVDVDLSGGVDNLRPSSDIYPVSLKLTAVKGDIRPYVWVEHDFAQRKDILPGTVYRIGVRTNVRDFVLDASFMGNAGRHPYDAATADWFSGYRAEVSRPIALGKVGTLTPMVGYIVPTGHGNGLVHNQFVAGIVWSKSFDF